MDKAGHGKEWTREDVKRLVPELTNVIHGISMVHATMGKEHLYFPLVAFELLLQTRMDLETARDKVNHASIIEDSLRDEITRLRGTLERIAHPLNRPSDPYVPPCDIAREALKEKS